MRDAFRNQRAILELESGRRVIEPRQLRLELRAQRLERRILADLSEAEESAGRRQEALAEREQFLQGGDGRVAFAGGVKRPAEKKGFALVEEIIKDVRDIEKPDLQNIDAIIHLAGLSNDTLGDLNPELTYQINHAASVRLAEMAKGLGITRFVFASSCSNYGAAGDAVLDESSALAPITPYAVSKVRLEEELAQLADERFAPVFLRNATAYGVSPRLRLDLVLNNLVGYAVIRGTVLMKSDGTPWRPLIHIEDISRAFASVLTAPREQIHNQVFNVCAPGENYQIRDVAEIVEKVVPGATIELADKAGPDLRDYRVDSSKISEMVPGFQPQWTVPAGVEQMYRLFVEYGIPEGDFLGKLLRIRWLLDGQAAGRITRDLRLTAGLA